MFDQDWFLTILDREELAHLCKKFKLKVPGFHRSLSNAPKKLLDNTLKIALTNGLKRRKVKNNDDFLPFDDMLIEISKEVNSKCSYISEVTFEEFALRAEMDQNISAYEIIAIMYVHYKDKYDENIEKIKENFKNKQFILNDLSESLNRSNLEKINKILETSILKESYYDVLKEFEDDILLGDSRVAYVRMKKIITDEETVFKYLVTTKQYTQGWILLAFLMNEDRYKNENYATIVQRVLYLIQKEELKETLENLNTIIEEVETLEKENEDIKEKYQRIEERREELEKENNSNKQNLKNAEEKVAELEKKKKRLDHVLKQNEPMQLFFFNLVTDNEFMIITKDVDRFLDTPFEHVSVSPSKFKKEIKQHTAKSFISQTLFITRGSFFSGRDWYQYRQFLEKHELKYVEIGEYDISRYIREITEHFNRKEIFVYADEI